MVSGFLSRKVILLDGDVLIKGDLLGLLKLSSLDSPCCERFAEIGSPCTALEAVCHKGAKQQPFSHSLSLSRSLSETPLPAVLRSEEAAAYQRLEGASTVPCPLHLRRDATLTQKQLSGTGRTWQMPSTTASSC